MGLKTGDKITLTAVVRHVNPNGQVVVDLDNQDPKTGAYVAPITLPGELVERFQGPTNVRAVKVPDTDRA